MANASFLGGCGVLDMEKSNSYHSFPDYPVSYVRARHGLEDHPKSFSFNGPSSQGSDEFGTSGNTEAKRRKRVASYNMYTMEGKLKSSVLNSFKWIKSKFRNDYFGS